VFKMHSFQVPPELHAKFKAACAVKKISMSEVITGLMEGFVNDLFGRTSAGMERLITTDPVAAAFLAILKRVRAKESIGEELNGEELKALEVVASVDRHVEATMAEMFGEEAAAEWKADQVKREQARAQQMVDLARIEEDEEQDGKSPIDLVTAAEVQDGKID